jgi:hypothetical protein
MRIKCARVLNPYYYSKGPSLTVGALLIAADYWQSVMAGTVFAIKTADLRDFLLALLLNPGFCRPFIIIASPHFSPASVASLTSAMYPGMPVRGPGCLFPGPRFRIETIGSATCGFQCALPLQLDLQILLPLYESTSRYSVFL